MNAVTTNYTRTWGGLILETRREFGSAARWNRGRHAGQKVHRLVSEYVVGVEEGSEHRPGSYGAKFLRDGQEIRFSCHPLCGCTAGQTAGTPYPAATEADVTCTKCGPAAPAADPEPAAAPEPAAPRASREVVVDRAPAAEPVPTRTERTGQIALCVNVARRGQLALFA